MDVGVVVFPGSNCDADTYRVLRDVLGYRAHYLWYLEGRLEGLDAVVLPGGFSYGDYLRAGAIAAVSPLVRALRPYVEAGGLVLGICNGFQVLLEAGLLPGAMLQNLGGEFRCQVVHVRTERADTPFTCLIPEGTVLRLPIAHSEGRYYADPETHALLLRRRQVVFRYCDPEGRVTAEAAPNGALDAIAGVASPDGAVVGLMPHPERASEEILGSTDGRRIFESLAHWIHYRGRAASRRVAEVRP